MKKGGHKDHPQKTTNIMAEISYRLYLNRGDNRGENLVYRSISLGVKGFLEYQPRVSLSRHNHLGYVYRETRYECDTEFVLLHRYGVGS